MNIIVKINHNCRKINLKRFYTIVQLLNSIKLSLLPKVLLTYFWPKFNTQYFYFKLINITHFNIFKKKQKNNHVTSQFSIKITGISRIQYPRRNTIFFSVLGFVSGTIYMIESKSILKRVVFRVLVPVQNPKIALYLYILGIFHSPLVSWY